MDRAPANVLKDERSPDLNTPCFEPGTQWSEVECAAARPSAPHFRKVSLWTANKTSLKWQYSLENRWITFTVVTGAVLGSNFRSWIGSLYRIPIGSVLNPMAGKYSEDFARGP